MPCKGAGFGIDTAFIRGCRLKLCDCSLTRLRIDQLAQETQTIHLVRYCAIMCPTPVVLPKTQRIPCPRCGMKTEHFLIEDFGVDRCLSCGAIWFDATELQRVEGCEHKARVLGSSADNKASVRHMLRLPDPMRCPRDATPLVLRKHWDQPDVDLDQCPTCHGMLLECGELTDLATSTWQERVRAWWSGQNV